MSAEGEGFKAIDDKAATAIPARAMLRMIFFMLVVPLDWV
jgi:hypothetical protein